MNISYSRPLELGWQRMKRALFQPFDLGRWMVLGFTAWLAQLADGAGGGDSGSDSLRISDDLNDGQWSTWGGEAWDWAGNLFNDAVSIMLVSFLVVIVLIVAIVVLWVSSRGRFMFLDNLVHGRTEVSHPWSEFKAQGDSLFLWQLAYIIAAMVLVTAVMGGFLILLVPAIALDLPGSIGIPAAIVLGIFLFVVVTVLAYIDYFLTQFIVPIMHKHRVSTTAAWGIFLPLFRANPAHFVVFGLFYLVIMLAMWIAFAIGGVLTCCLGLLLMVLPYIGAVVTLPISVLGRFMNLEFLAQFGDDFNLLPPQPGNGPVPPPHPYGPETGSGDFHVDGTVVRTEDVGQDAGPDESGPQGP